MAHTPEDEAAFSLSSAIDTHTLAQNALKASDQDLLALIHRLEGASVRVTGNVRNGVVNDRRPGRGGLKPDGTIDWGTTEFITTLDDENRTEPFFRTLGGIIVPAPDDTPGIRVDNPEEVSRDPLFRGAIGYRAVGLIFELDASLAVEVLDLAISERA